MAKKIFTVGGIRGLAVRFEGADTVKRGLAQLPYLVQRKVLRLAVAAAARPVTAAVRQGAKAYSAGSLRKEGIGTTTRSIVQKVATSKSNPAVAYAVIGARKGYTEFVTLDSDHKVSAIQVAKRIRKAKGRTVVNGRSLTNLGPIARKARLNPKSNSTHKRVPSRYLHLIEIGGKKRRIRAGRFIETAARSTIVASRTKFAEVLEHGVKRELALYGFV